MNIKRNFSELIQQNITKYGYHLTIVQSAIEPRFAYTIGLSDSIGFEIVFAGGIYYMEDDLDVIVKAAYNELKRGNILSSISIEVERLGTFSTAKVDTSWSRLMLLGVTDYYSTDNIAAVQIIPDSSRVTLDVPNMSTPWSAQDPIWQWLVKKWDYDVPERATVITNLDALRGEPITELMRWEEDEWEMFAGAGPEVKEEDSRVVSLGTMLGIDNTLTAATNLDVGKGLWRESIVTDWNDWG